MISALLHEWPTLAQTSVRRYWITRLLGAGSVPRILVPGRIDASAAASSLISRNGTNKCHQLGIRHSKQEERELEANWLRSRRRDGGGLDRREGIPIW